ncbi:MAG: SurA N-terminal domain-containing protein [Rickettsiales bacterium]|nr:SurA N-terminal domain-containing protein [Rickettsiales bacterium]
MRKIVIIFLVLFCYFEYSKAENFEIFIVAKVDKNVVTNYDVIQRLQFLSYQTGVQVSQENFTQLFLQTREMYIDELIKKTAAEELNITVSSDEVDNVIADIAFRNNISLEDFKSKLVSIIDSELFYQQIENQLLWQKYLYSTVFNDINVNEYEIDEYKQSAAANKFYKYDIVEFYVGDDQNSVDKFANEYYQQLKEGKITFAKLQEQFNASSVNKQSSTENFANNINPELLEIIDKLAIGELSKPFNYGENVVIIRLLNVESKILTYEQIKEKLFYNKFERKVDTIFDNLKLKAFVERYDNLA